GTRVFSATLSTTGSQTITATDSLSSSITGTSSAITVALGATHFMVNAPSSTTAGNGFLFTVTALDVNNNTVSSYTGTVHFSSGDGQASLPGNTTLTNGVGMFMATLKTSGSQTITATDASNSLITGTSGAINVSASTPVHLAFGTQPVSTVTNQAITPA